MTVTDAMLDRAAANWARVAAHYRAALATARDVDPTGEGVALYERLMNKALDEFAAVRGGRQ